MRNKIAGTFSSSFNLLGLDFKFHKYYSPQNPLEENFTSLIGFRRTCSKYNGIYVCTLPDGAKIFAVRFSPSCDEFPFITLTDYCTYKDGYVFLGTDIKKQAYFMPVP